MNKKMAIYVIPILIALIYFITWIILTLLALSDEIIENFSLIFLYLLLGGTFICIGYIISKREKYTKKQKITLMIILLIIGFLDLILVISAQISGLGIYYFLMGICIPISFGILAISLASLEIRIAKY